MSVLVSRRKLAASEYAMNFTKLQQKTRQQLEKIPKRKYRWLADPINNLMNKIFDLIMSSVNDYYHYGIKLKNNIDIAKAICRELYSLGSHLIALWNIEDYTEKAMTTWANAIDNEIKLVLQMGGISFKKDQKYMIIIEKKSVASAKYVGVMCQLHKLIYSKVISSPRYSREGAGRLLITLADRALFSVIDANSKIPTTKKMYEHRKQCIEDAINCINEMEIPTLGFFEVMGYTEYTMQQWADLLAEEKKLLTGIQKSDKEKYSNLE